MKEKERERKRDRDARDDSATKRRAEKRKRCEDYIREDDHRRLLSRCHERAKDARYANETHKDGNYSHKCRDIVDRVIRNRNHKQRENIGRDKRNHEDKCREGNRSRECLRNKYGFERLRDEIGVTENCRNKIRDQSCSSSSSSDASLINIDVCTSDEDDKGSMGSDNKEDLSETTSRIVYEKHSVVEKKNGRARAQDGSYRDKYGDIFDEDDRYKNYKKRECVERERGCRDKQGEQHVSRDCSGNKCALKHVKDDIGPGECCHKKARAENSNNDVSPINIDICTGDDYDTGKRGSDNIGELRGTRSRCVDEQHYDAGRKNGRLQDGSYTGKYRELVDGDLRYRDFKQREVGRKKRCQEVKQGEQRASRDCPDYRYDSKHVRDEIGTGESCHKKVRAEDSDCDGCPINIDVCTSDEDDKEMRGSDNEEQSETTSQCISEQHYHTEGKYMINKKSESVTISEMFDSHTPPMQAETSLSPTGVNSKCMNRGSVGQSSNVEESGQMDIDAKDARNLTGDGHKGTEEMLIKTSCTVEFSQAHGDRISASSSRLVPSCRSFRSYNNYNTTRMRPGVGSSGQNSQGKSNQWYKRSGDSNVGRPRGNPWKVASYQYSPARNNSIPYQHAPPAAGFNVMQQFCAPQYFDIRHSVESKLFGPLYDIPSVGRFSNHWQPYAFHNTVHGPCLPRLNVLDADNGAIKGEAHIYEEHYLDYNRTLMSGQGRVTNLDKWKGQSSDVRLELSFTDQNEDHSENAPADEALETAMLNTEASNKVLMMSRNHDAHYWNAYLSKIDISEDLTDPELYDLYLTLMDIEPKITAEEDCPKLLHVEGVAKARVNVSNDASNASLFAAFNDSVFKKAISFYKKQREEIHAILYSLLGNTDEGTAVWHE